MSGRFHDRVPAPGDAGEPIAELPFSAELGMRLHRAGAGIAILSVPYDPRLVGDPGTGVLHGGVITALLDTACGWAVMVSGAALRGTATLDLRIDYMRPASAGQAVVARAECYRLTRAIAFARAVAYHGDPAAAAEPGDAAQLVATAQGAFMLDRAEPADPAAAGGR